MAGNLPKELVHIVRDVYESAGFSYYESSEEDYYIFYVGLNSKLFDKIDEIALSGITSSAYPGCQVVVAVKGKIIYRKCFGKYTYDADALPVNHESMYDIASITKIASSTLTTMILHHEGKIDHFHGRDQWKLNCAFYPVHSR